MELLRSSISGDLKMTATRSMYSRSSLFSSMVIVVFDAVTVVMLTIFVTVVVILRIIGSREGVDVGCHHGEGRSYRGHETS
jgi:hypothetical protein